MNTHIRMALPADVAALLTLSRRTIGASYRPFLGDGAVDAFLGEEVERYVRENIARSWVMTDGVILIGYAVCREDLIDLMMIDLAWQRRGLGTELLRHVEESLFTQSDELTLESFERNRPANQFYRKHGWREAECYLDPDSGAHKLVFKKCSPGPAKTRSGKP